MGMKGCDLADRIVRRREVIAGDGIGAGFARAVTPVMCWMATGLTARPGFSPEDRHEDIRRVGDVAALFASAGFSAKSASIPGSNFLEAYKPDYTKRMPQTQESPH
jgi:hypothetical protein